MNAVLKMRPVLILTGVGLVATAVLGFPLWVGLLVDSAEFETQPCRIMPDGAAWCEEVRFDDGWVRRSLSVTDQPGCCLWQRVPLSAGAHREDRLMCAASALPDCAAYQGPLSGNAILVDGVTLTPRP